MDGGKNMVTYCSECGREESGNLSITVNDMPVCVFCIKKLNDMIDKESNDKIVEIVLNAMQKHKTLFEGVEADKVQSFTSQVAADILLSFYVRPNTCRMPPLEIN